MAFADCRFYEAQYPELDDLVKVQVKRIAEMGAYVSLLEYNNIEGMIQLSELSKRRIRSISKLVRVGRTEVVMVLRVDQEKGYIDLSKRRVSPEDVTQCEEKFNKSKTVHSIMRHVAGQHKEPLLDLCKRVAWPLYSKYGHAFEAFKAFMNDDEDIFQTIDVADDIKESVKVQIQRRLISQVIRLRAKIECSCYEYEGIDAVKESLLAGLKGSAEESELTIKLIAPPLYSLVCVCNDKEVGMKKIDQSIQQIQDTITSKKGAFSIRAKPEIIGADDKLEAEESDSENSKSGSDSDSQDETMGNANFDEEELKKKTGGDIKDDDDDDDA
eukprot:gnl/MRDRNA2_/MRDRNA2_91733_c0_seq1.p1 gnl/MRDRNA2_/MRDRNA2_91733_c0~~gnl/MRDRNA2_/MRDRNA2_91733_c0_seq1.p1  ORF type:complete len:354 (+),score=91.43 gnl/MRDRNA2_/MRDRNA2_91733_c0_seq1:80-1063(+)